MRCTGESRNRLTYTIYGGKYAGHVGVNGIFVEEKTSKCGFPKHKKEEAALLMYKRLIYRFNRITLPGGMARNLVPAHHQRARSNRCAGMNMSCWQCDGVRS